MKRTYSTTTGLSIYELTCITTNTTQIFAETFNKLVSRIPLGFIVISICQINFGNVRYLGDK